MIEVVQGKVVGFKSEEWVGLWMRVELNGNPLEWKTVHVDCLPCSEQQARSWLGKEVRIAIEVEVLE